MAARDYQTMGKRMTGGGRWRIFTDVDAARGSLLKRFSLRDVDVPEAALARSAALFGERLAPEDAVRRIIGSVRQGGDDALREWNRKLDGTETDALLVSPDALQAALAAIPSDLRGALETAAARIRVYHQKQPLHSWIDAGADGSLGQLDPPGRLGRRLCARRQRALALVLAHERHPGAGGGRAGDYRLHTARQRWRRRPPGHFGGGRHRRRRTRLPRRRRAGHRRHGIRYGQHTAGRYHRRRRQPLRHAGEAASLRRCRHRRLAWVQPRLWSSPMKRADPVLAAADLLAQAEHDVLASAILLTPSRDSGADGGELEIDSAAGAIAAPRADSRRHAQPQRHRCHARPGASPLSWRMSTPPSTSACCWKIPGPGSGKVRNAGGVFLGEHSYEVLGDYVAGPSHVMPTGGTARFASPLNLLSFVKVTSLIALESRRRPRAQPAGAVNRPGRVTGRPRRRGGKLRGLR